MHAEFLRIIALWGGRLGGGNALIIDTVLQHFARDAVLLAASERVVCSSLGVEAFSKGEK